MRGLDPRIHVFVVCRQGKKGVDGRIKSGHDGKSRNNLLRAIALGGFGQGRSGSASTNDFQPRHVGQGAEVGNFCIPDIQVFNFLESEQGRKVGNLSCQEVERLQPGKAMRR